MKPKIQVNRQQNGKWKTPAVWPSATAENPKLPQNVTALITSEAGPFGRSFICHLFSFQLTRLRAAIGQASGRTDFPL